jgi:hypothetical protein
MYYCSGSFVSGLSETRRELTWTPVVEGCPIVELEL